MVLPVVYVLSAGIISASGNTKKHHHLFVSFNVASFNCTAGLGQLLSLIRLDFYM